MAFHLVHGIVFSELAALSFQKLSETIKDVGISTASKVRRVAGYGLLGAALTAQIGLLPTVEVPAYSAYHSAAMKPTLPKQIIARKFNA